MIGADRHAASGPQTPTAHLAAGANPTILAGQKVRSMHASSRRYLGMLLTSAFLFTLQGSCQNNAASPLQVSFGANGLQTLSYNGTTLADLGAHPGDNFYIGHLKATDMSGNVLSGGQYGWGEVNNGKSWNAADPDLELHLQLGHHQRSVRPERHEPGHHHHGQQQRQLRHHLRRRCSLPHRPALSAATQRLRPAKLPAAGLQHYGPQRHDCGLGWRRGHRSRS